MVCFFKSKNTVIILQKRKVIFLGFSTKWIAIPTFAKIFFIMEYRIERDTMGEVQVPADKYWGAQTERSRNNFKIGPEASMPKEIIYAFAYLKKAAAYANHELGT